MLKNPGLDSGRHCCTGQSWERIQLDSDFMNSCSGKWGPPCASA